MEKSEQIYLASKAFDKGYDYEKMKYSDDLYGREESIEEIWEYVIELKEDGMNAFREKYYEYKIY